MIRVFADSFFYFALLNQDDPANARATGLLRQPGIRITTSEYVLFELLDGLSSPRRRQSASLLVRALRRQPDTTIVPAEPRLSEEGFDLYRSRPDKAWSLTDCTSFIVMQRDAGFRQSLHSLQIPLPLPPYPPN